MADAILGADRPARKFASREIPTAIPPIALEEGIKSSLQHAKSQLASGGARGTPK